MLELKTDVVNLRLKADIPFLPFVTSLFTPSSIVTSPCKRVIDVEVGGMDELFNLVYESNSLNFFNGDSTSVPKEFEMIKKPLDH